MIKNRHAYLLLVHKNQKQLEILLELLDIETNDIFIHVDAKSKNIDLNRLSGCTKKANVFITERIDIKWADYSIVEATYILLKTAVKQGPHLYYHLLSGQDLPLKRISEINEYFEIRDVNVNYLFYGPEQWNKNVMYNRHFYNWFNKLNWMPDILQKVIRKIIRESFVKYNSWKIKYSAGSQWFDINYDLAKAIVNNKAWVDKSFKYDFCADEAFLLTFVKFFGFENTIEKNNSNNRMVNWGNTVNQQSPGIYIIDDFDRIMNSGMLFARKFDENVDMEIILKIRNIILNTKKS